MHSTRPIGDTPGNLSGQLSILNLSAIIDAATFSHKFCFFALLFDKNRAY
jgi:hypothetical protein